MKKIAVIAIFDIGKTNKKLLLFDRHYHLVYAESQKLEETLDEDGFPCEDIHQLTNWVLESYKCISKDEKFEIVAVNISAYGASFVLLDDQEQVCMPLYNYLKPYLPETSAHFYQHYGNEELIAAQTASPTLGNLNSGMQLYRLKQEQPQQFKKVKHALHLPNYISYLLTGKLYSEITSIGCHTQLWNFDTNRYHEWVLQEGLEHLLAPVQTATTACAVHNSFVKAGIGLHDSSSALIPYLSSIHEPFILLSTGTWCICLNPFNHSPLRLEELKQDCLCYLSYQGNPIKAARNFAGYQHEQQNKILAQQFRVAEDAYHQLVFDQQLVNKLKKQRTGGAEFAGHESIQYQSYEEAYYALLLDLIALQVRSIHLVQKDTVVTQLFVDGGFSKNSIFMQLIADAFPELRVYAATLAQASALGAALVMHQHWNPLPVPKELIGVQSYSR